MPETEVEKGMGIEMLMDNSCDQVEAVNRDPVYI